VARLEVVPFPFYPDLRRKTLARPAFNSKLLRRRPSAVVGRARLQSGHPVTKSCAALSRWGFALSPIDSEALPGKLTSGPKALLEFTSCGTTEACLFRFIRTRNLRELGTISPRLWVPGFFKPSILLPLGTMFSIRPQHNFQSAPGGRQDDRRSTSNSPGYNRSIW
jgi:hypothetical protein